MQVYRDFNIAKDEMAKLAKKTHEVIYLTYTLYGNNPHKIEFNLCTKSELVGGKATTRLMYQYSPVVGVVEFKTLEEIEEELGEKLFLSIRSAHHCGDEPLRGSTNSLEEIHFKNNDYE